MRIRDWSSDVCSSDLGTYGAKAVVNAPLTADVALRVAGQYSHSDGYARNIRTGEKLQGGERYSGRAQLQGEFGRLTALLSADYSRDDLSGDARYGVRSRVAVPVVLARMKDRKSTRLNHRH